MPSALDNRPLAFDEFEAFNFQRIFYQLPGKIRKARADATIDLVIRPTGLLDPPVEVRPVNIQVDDLMAEAQQRIQRGERVLVTTLTKKVPNN